MSVFSLPNTFWSQHRASIAIGVLVVFYAVGAVGTLWPLHPDFMRLTPLNLLLSAGLLLWNDETPRARLWPALSVAFAGGMAVEWLGVHTGFPFGDYSYGGALGPKVGGVPLTIGLNWAMLLLCSATLAQRILGPSSGVWVRAALGAAAMTALDVWLEPAAVRFDFWSWRSEALYEPLLVAPWQNYAAWFAAAFALLLAWHRWVPDNRNPVAIPLWSIQMLFFFLLFVL
jgi:putative membrane protein